jgi:Kef-type K+ transport system membrane component KefB
MNRIQIHFTGILSIAFLAVVYAWYVHLAGESTLVMGTAFLVSAACLAGCLLNLNRNRHRFQIVLLVSLVLANVLLLLSLLRSGWKIGLNIESIERHIGSTGIVLLVICGILLGVFWGRWLLSRLGGNSEVHVDSKH